MKWTVRVKKPVEKQFSQLPDDRTRHEVAAKIAQLAETPFPLGSKKLNRPGSFYRLRVGDFRIVYSVEKTARLVEVIGVRHRKDVYRGW